MKTLMFGSAIVGLTLGLAACNARAGQDIDSASVKLRPGMTVADATMTVKGGMGLITDDKVITCGLTINDPWMCRMVIERDDNEGLVMAFELKSSHWFLKQWAVVNLPPRQQAAR